MLCDLCSVPLQLGMAVPAHGAAMDTLVFWDSYTAEQISQSADLLTYLRSAQQLTVTIPPRYVGHTATALLEDYTVNGFPAEFGLEWSLETIRHAIGKGPHYSTLSLDSTAFYRKDILEQNHQGFSIVLSVTNYITVFCKALCISLLALVDQVNRDPRLIYNSRKYQDATTPPSNASTDKGTLPKEMKFGACLSCLPQQIWDADPTDSPVWLYK